MADYSGGMNAMAQVLAGPGNPSPTDVDYLTPQGAWQQRAMAQQLLQMDPSATKGGWASALAGLLSGVNAGRMMNQTRQAQGQAMGASAEDLANTYGSVQGAYGGGGAGGAQANGDPISNLGAGIAKVESGGNYQAVGNPTKSGDRAFGKYQVMGQNVPKWTQEILGQSLTPQQFLANPQAQEAVFRGKIGQYIQQTGNLHDAASMWFSGRPLAQALAMGNRPDVNGMRPSNYVVAALRGAQGSQGAVGQPGPQGASGAVPPMQVAQNMPQQGGFNNQAAARAMVNPYTPDQARNQIGALTTPQQVGIPGGGAAYVLPSQGPQARQSVGGVLPQSVTASPNSVNVPVNPTIGVNGPNGPQGGVGGGSIKDTVTNAANLGASVSDIGTAQGIRNDDVNKYAHAQEMAGKIASIRLLGDHLKDGAFPIWAALGLQHGINVSEDAGRYAVYKAEINNLLGDMGPAGAGLADRIPALGAPKDARDAFMDFVNRPFAYQQARSQRAMQGVMTNEDPKVTSKALADIPQPESVYPETKTQTAGSGKTGGGAGTSGANAGGQPQYKEGQTAVSKDGSKRMIFKGGKWLPL